MIPRDCAPGLSNHEHPCRDRIGQHLEEHVWMDTPPAERNQDRKRHALVSLASVDLLPAKE